MKIQISSNATLNAHRAICELDGGLILCIFLDSSLEVLTSYLSQDAKAETFKESVHYKSEVYNFLPNTEGLTKIESIVKEKAVSILSSIHEKVTADSDLALDILTDDEKSTIAKLTASLPQMSPDDPVA